ncbi:MAG TPA: DNA polymerase ligase N-terminal domain-containing protein [Acidimicrobiales bacterium]|nr:DNA polymerase ligase N-terminal domain-containing protein [Acidimicrobiales bacterium]
MPRELDEYDRKRDFTATPEPRGEAPPSDGDELGGRFVIQQHDATRLHWDLRLEHDGVLLSWALPRGLPWDPGRNHLAVHTEDHPLEYLEFEGDIPDGNYGAGHMFVWDTGSYTAEKITDDKVVFTLAGERAGGRHALFQTDGRNWMIHRMDPPVDPDRRHLPDRFPLLVPDAGPTPDDPGEDWAVEPRWRGLRVAVVSSGGVVDVLADGHFPVTDVFPEIRPIGRALGYTEAALDGVLVAPAGAADRLHRRLSVKSDSTRRKLARDIPMSFMAVDLLWQDGYPLADRPWRERRDRLEDLALSGPAWATPSAATGDTAALVEASAGAGLDEVVLKRVDAPYDPDAEPRPWRIVPTG